MTFEAEDGEEGLQLVLDRHPDLILLDILMPKIDGMAALRELRKDVWGRNAVVVIFTNLNAAKERFSKDEVAFGGCLLFC